jgi:hypothetical protein
MRRTWTAVLVATFVLAGCGGANAPEAPAPAPFDPVGSYVGQTSAQGQTVGLTIEITGEPGSYSGVVRPSADLPSIPLHTVVVEGQTITARGDAMGEALVLTMTVSGAEFTGSWSVAGMSGALVGARR